MHLSKIFRVLIRICLTLFLKGLGKKIRFLYLVLLETIRKNKVDDEKVFN